MSYREDRTDLCEACKWEEHPCCGGEEGYDSDCSCCANTINTIYLLRG